MELGYLSLSLSFFSLTFFSSMKIGQIEFVHSQRFSLSEFKWDHTYDLYLSGIVLAIHWDHQKVLHV